MRQRVQIAMQYRCIGTKSQGKPATYRNANGPATKAGPKHDMNVNMKQGFKCVRHYLCASLFDAHSLRPIQQRRFQPFSLHQSIH